MKVLFVVAGLVSAGASQMRSQPQVSGEEDNVASQLLGCPDECSGHGTCAFPPSGPLHCKCDSGYKGANCSETTSPGGVQRWSFKTGDGVDSSPTISADGSTVFFGSWDNSLYAVDAATGAMKWSFATGGWVRSSPAISADGSTVFVGSDDNNLYAVDAATGAKKWSFKTGDLVVSSPAISADGSTVFVGSRDHNLYALATGDSFRSTAMSS